MRVVFCLIITICHDQNLLEEGCCGCGGLPLKQDVDRAGNGVAQLQCHDDGDGGGARNCVKHNCKVINNVLICIEHIVFDMLMISDES